MRRLLGLFVAAFAAPALTFMYSTGGLLNPSEVVNKDSESDVVELPITTSNSTESKNRKRNPETSSWLNTLTKEDQELLKNFAEKAGKKPWKKFFKSKEEEAKKLLAKAKEESEKKKKTTGPTSTVQDEDYRPPNFKYRF